MEQSINIALTAEELRMIIREEIAGTLRELYNDKVVSRKEAAEILEKSPQTIARMERRGVLVPEFVRGSGHPRYRMADVLKIKGK